MPIFAGGQPIRCGRATYVTYAETAKVLFCSHPVGAAVDGQPMNLPDQEGGGRKEEKVRQLSECISF